MARKEIWDLLADYKNKNNDFIILLTTHHLEEAELLADKIIILSHGEVKFYGSTQSLLHKYGNRFILKIINNIDPIVNYEQLR